jgi:hypothetical protein
MTFQEILEAVKALTPDEWDKLENQIIHERQRVIAHTFAQLKQNLTNEQISDIALAISGNVDYTRLNLPSLLSVIEMLTSPDQQVLRTYLDNLYQATLKVKLARLDDAVAEIHANLTPDEIAQVVHAMNVEYIEPFDENEWHDDPISS